MANRRFSEDILGRLRDAKRLRIRAGEGKHRFIGIWMVILDNRVFVRSWSLKEPGWYRTFLEDSGGCILLGSREVPVRAVRTRSEPMKAAIDRAYLKKYATGSELKYAKDLVRTKSRDATIELVPAE